ncbi:MAG: protoporphyrinogen oxidase [Ignavibacteriaceae bacterium]|nr:protoporphyrinogen oxidase [Ignavibacteriaceae bacterium]
MNNKIVILGAGISGLTTAYLLNKDGYDVTVLEKKNEVGGSIETVFDKGYLFDRGPNSGLETTPLIEQIVNDLKLSDQFVYANRKGNKRYILRNDVLHPLPMNPKSFLKSRLFSSRGKFRLFAELFIGRSKDGYYQSIGEFVKRRLGQEFLDYAINPFVAGVYAGNPEDLSVKSAFPKLYALEEKYGGLIKGTIKSIKERKNRPEKSKQDAKMFSFNDGMQVFPLAISEFLGEKVHLNSEVNSVETVQSGYKINYSNSGGLSSVDCNYLISTIPAYTASTLFGRFDSFLAEHLNKIYYPPVLVLFIAYDIKDIGQPLDGFGFLIPAKEKKSFLGAIWSSVLFPNRAGEGQASFTLFIGGARDPGVLTYDKDLLIKRVRNEFETLMRIVGEPIYLTYKFWPKAIPQYNLGYIEHENYFDKFEKDNPGILLSGNYREGISVGDCIKNSEKILNKIKKLSNKEGV